MGIKNTYKHKNHILGKIISFQDILFVASTKKQTVPTNLLKKKATTPDQGTLINRLLLSQLHWFVEHNSSISCNSIILHHHGVPDSTTFHATAHRSSRRLVSVCASWKCERVHSEHYKKNRIRFLPQMNPSLTFFAAVTSGVVTSSTFGMINR